VIISIIVGIVFVKWERTICKNQGQFAVGSRNWPSFYRNAK